MRVVIQDAAFDPSAELARFDALGGGAVVTFNGVVRDDTGDLQSMEIEHYAGMTEAALRAFVDTAVARFELTNALVIHRYGSLKPGDVIMMVATASKHRKQAFQGADFLMDYLKSRAPFWKKEIRAGGADWVDAKDVDEDALKGW